MKHYILLILLSVSVCFFSCSKENTDEEQTQINTISVYDFVGTWNMNYVDKESGEPEQSGKLELDISKQNEKAFKFKMIGVDLIAEFNGSNLTIPTVITEGPIINYATNGEGKLENGTLNIVLYQGVEGLPPIRQFTMNGTKK